ncbi:hypothetical protein K501DRAFT_288028 [Backusella circina FSU 941]|nr:hypothetical protein K501DRAFT_288028 [Backusella circina FSU 941]
MLNEEDPVDLLMDQEEQAIDRESNFYLSEDSNDPFHLANRTFYTTCHKISRQNSPSYRKKPPYTFLENWFIHLVFSKSQQILLRFPVIQPRVMMTEGDFIYTPHQMATTSDTMFDQSYDYDYEDDEEEDDYDYDDTFIIGDEGVMVMSASAPDASQISGDLVMDENMWMGHSRYNQNGLSLHVVNGSPLDEEREDPDPMYHNHQLNTNNPYRSIVNNPYNIQLQAVKEEEEEEEEEDEEDEYSNEEEEQHTNNEHINMSHEKETIMYEDQQHHHESESDDMSEEEPHSLSISPELIDWYRSGDLRPVKSTSDLLQQLGCENHPPEFKVANSNSSSSSSSSSRSSTSSRHYQQRTDLRADEAEKTPTRHSSESYQSLADMMPNTSYGTLLPLHHTPREARPILNTSISFANAVWVAVDMAQGYHQGGVSGFISCMVNICKVFFLGAEGFFVKNSSLV